MNKTNVQASQRELRNCQALYSCLMATGPIRMFLSDTVLCSVWNFDRRPLDLNFAGVLWFPMFFSL